ncbi:uncharacterized protein LOC141690408 [Apium graveolens]|uniref:uncharacterized protein LOC141690408 n=1 Tax=Apium graveolens TaxID=4045 RepID=UPI003D7A031E
MDLEVLDLRSLFMLLRGHLYENGFSLGYTEWIWHGEKCFETRSSAGSTYLPAPESANLFATQTKKVCEASYDMGDYDEEAREFKRFVADTEQPLFEGNDCTKLESMLKLHNRKLRFGISAAAFTELLSSVGSFLPTGHVFPVNAYESKKNLSDLGLDYIKFRACPNDYILYRGIYSESSKCPKCNLSRWKLGKDGRVRTNISAKVLWYFPIIPRFKLLFKSTSTAEMMTWHSHHRIQDGLMRHPADSPSWRNVDHRWPRFGSESINFRLTLSADEEVFIPRFKLLFKSTSIAEMMTWHSDHRIQDGPMRHPADSPSWRNVDHRWPSFGSESINFRLTLSADGINPYNNGLTNRYTCWPVVLVTYNLPPWLCMKRKFRMLTLLVYGPHEPGNNIDVYLQPMINNLKKLWEEGELDLFDVHIKSYFTLRAMLLWMINDFPAYGNLSGCINKGYMACPVYCKDTIAKYLTHSRKICYQGHHKYLP